MGVSMNTYVAVGVEIVPLLEEKLREVYGEDIYEDKFRIGNLSVVHGMDGLELLGRILDRSADGRYDPMDISCVVQETDLTDLFRECEEDLDRFGEKIDMEIPRPNLIVKTVYS